MKKTKLKNYIKPTVKQKKITIHLFTARGQYDPFGDLLAQCCQCPNAANTTHWCTLGCCGN